MIPAVAAVISRLRQRAIAVPDRAVALLFAVVAYVPMLLTAPGRVSADTKTYLALDPGRVLAQASSMWDPSVGAGTVPHQNIGYLFPLGPYYWLMDAISMPDWVAQRLLWGTLAFSAAFGAYKLMRWLGWEVSAAIVTGAAYGLSPFMLSYLARLSAILGPWAAMPWLMLFAARAVRTRSWRPAAWFALVIALVGSVNATSLVLAGLAVVVWLIVDVAGRRVSLIDGLAGVGKIGVLCLGVSAWWIAGLRIQGTYGIPILRYTETYQAVASSSTPPEILRGLGYWFFYGGDRLDTWVGPSAAYTDSAVLMLIGFGIAGLSMLGLLTVFPGRIRAVTMLLVGLIVSVGAAPLSGPSWYGRAFEWLATESTAGAALRSTPRAAPLVILALAMGLGAGSQALSRHIEQRPVARFQPVLMPVMAVALVCVQLFPWFTGRITTPSLERAEALPTHVTDLADYLDEQDQGRVYALPGSDFANYRWGGTVDPVLPGLVDRDVLFRELVPQGGAATADLLNAFERRLAEGWFEPSSLEPVAGLLNVSTLVVRNDLEYERYRLARPGPLWNDVTSVLGDPDHAGPTVAGTPVIPIVDESTLARDGATQFPISAAFELADASPATLSSTPPMIVAGSGDGLVDLAAAGLLDPERPVLYAAGLDDDVEPGAWWVVTDTNRKQGRHWSTIGSNLGALESAGPLVLDNDPGDQQLDVFADQRLSDQTIALHQGGIADVRASYYGNKIAYTPEDAPWFALDGDPTTAWRAGVFDEAVGLVWETDLAEPAPSATITVLQPLTGVVDRFITSMHVTLDNDTSIDVALDERSRRSPGQQVELPRAGYTALRLEVIADNLGPLSTYAGRPGVGLAEVTIPGIVDDRTVRTPTNIAPHSDDRLTYVFTRQRIDPATTNRSAPEPQLDRTFDVDTDRQFEVTAQARLSSTADDHTLQTLLSESPAVIADRRLPGDVGSRGASAYDDDPATSWQTPFDDVTGATLMLPGASETVDDVVTVNWLDDGNHSIPTEITIRTGDRTDTLAVPPTAPIDGLATASINVGRSASEQTVLTITGIDARLTPEYFSGVLQTLPVGLTDVRFASDAERVNAVQFDTTCRTDLLLLDGEPLPVRISGQTDSLLRDQPAMITACEPVSLTAGRHRLEAVPGALTGLDLDRVVVDSGTQNNEIVAVVEQPVVTTLDDTAADIAIGPVSVDSWLSWNQSWNAGWSATIDGVDLGDPTVIDGYANGWRISPSSHDRLVQIRWTPQGSVDVALIISALFGLVILGLLAATCRHRPQRRDLTRPQAISLHPAITAITIGLLFFVVGGLPAALAALGLAMIGQRVPWLHVALLCTVWSLVSLGIVAIEVRRDYPAGPDWPARFGWASPLTWIVIAAVVAPVALQALSSSWRADTAPGEVSSSGSDAL